VYGCEKTEAIKVNVIPNIEMLVSPNDTLCAGFQVQLFARGAERYEWSPSAGLNNAFISSPIATPTVSTRYRVIGHSNGSCFSDTGYVFIQVAPVPGVNAGPDVEGQTGSTVNLAATAQGNVTSWSWSPAAGLSCNDCPNPVLTISGNTTYELTVKNRYGCTAKDSLRVITLCNNTPTALGETFTFNIDCECSKWNESFRLHWLNPLGGFDAFTFKQKFDRNFQIKKSNYTKILGSVSGAGAFTFTTAQAGEVNFDTRTTETIKIMTYKD
jgi:hypothetical protein